MDFSIISSICPVDRFNDLIDMFGQKQVAAFAGLEFPLVIPANATACICEMVAGCFGSLYLALLVPFI